MAKVFEREYTFTSMDHSTQIHVHEWEPDCDINGVVQIAHGVAEYIERYSDFAKYLASKGFLVVGNDHLGHGKSAKTPDDLGFFKEYDGWNTVVRDIEKLRTATAKRFPDVPYFIFGHSMGSFLTRTYLIRYPDAPLTGVILSGTGENPTPVLLAGLAMCGTVAHREGPRYRSEFISNIAFGAYNKNFQPQRTPYDWLSRDPAVADKYVADPLCGYLCTVGLFKDLMGGCLYNSKLSNAEKMNKELPIYFMSGDKDPVGGDGVGVAKAYSLFCRAGMKDVFYKFYPEGRHEMLNELNKDEVYKDVLDWLFKKIY